MVQVYWISTSIDISRPLQQLFKLLKFVSSESSCDGIELTPLHCEPMPFITYYRLFFIQSSGFKRFKSRCPCVTIITESFKSLSDHLKVSIVAQVSTFFSLFSVCWSLASFNKNVTNSNVHKIVLTWFGVICQLAWRFGGCFKAFFSILSQDNYITEAYKLSHISSLGAHKSFLSWFLSFGVIYQLVWRISTCK